ncbi:MAG: DUF4011 domain-containing protein [Bacilli bacterium]|nr:DUF4011 domain-containing protein [Bacilli bacterium]
MIAVDGIKNPLEVTIADYYSIEELDIPLEDMLVVKAVAREDDGELSKRTINTMSKVTDKENEIQTKEEEEEIEGEKEEKEEYLVEEEEAVEETIDPDKLSFSLKMDSSFSLVSYETDLAIHAFDRGNKTIGKTEYAFIQELRLNNPTDFTLRGLRIVFRFADALLTCEETLLPAIEYREEIWIRIPFIKVDREALLSLDAPLASSLTVELYSPKGKLLAQKSENFFILPIGEMNHFFEYDPRLWCKFVTPGASEIKDLTVYAADKTPEKHFLAYQNEDLNAMAKELSCLYETLVEVGITYQNPPASTTPFQKVRLPSQVLLDHKGTCLDLSILFAAMAQEVGYHPLLLIFDKHAMVAVFLDEKDKYENARNSKLGSFYNKVSGKGDVIVFDAVDMTNPAISFKQAIEDGLEYLRVYSGDFLACDVEQAHKSIFLPLALQGQQSALDPEALSRKAKEEELSPIIKNKYNEVHHESNKDRFTFWENKLLDLNESNPLVSFRFAPTNFVKLVRKNLGEYLLSEKPLGLRFIETGGSTRAEQIAEIRNSDEKAIPAGSDLDYGYLFGKIRSFRSILSKNNSEIEETGAPTLYLCMGLLSYRTSDYKRKAKTAYAPFMLLPIKIEKVGLGTSSYNMVYDYDDAMVNKTFFEYYKLEHPDFDVSPLYKSDRSIHDSFHDLVMTFKDKVSDDISLDETVCFISNLTFAHFIMWTDMVLRKDELKKNKVVSSIVNRQSMLEETGLDVETIEREEHYRDFAAPLPYDSTQLSAILEASEGKSFILDGPPGTGKSQTIVNIIVNAIYHGKTVLFVAEKKAALDVVADRLKKIKLDRFCLELHSTKANKRDFFAKLGESIRLGPTEGEGNFVSTVNALEGKRADIKAKIAAMHEAKDYCLSFYEAITVELNLGNKTRPFAYPKELIAKVRRGKYFEAIDFLNQFTLLAKNYGKIEDSQLKRVGLDFFSYNDVEAAGNEMADLKEEIEDFVRKFGVLLEGSNINLPLRNEYISALLEAYGLALDENVYYERLENYLTLDDAHIFDPLFHKAEALLDLKKSLEKDFKLDVFEYSTIEYLLKRLSDATSFFSRLFANREVKGYLEIGLTSGRKIDKYEYGSVLENIKKYISLHKDIETESFGIDKYLSKGLLENIDALESTKEGFMKTYRLSTLIRSLEILPGCEDIASSLYNVAKNKDFNLKRHYGVIMASLATLKEKETAFFAKYRLTKEDFDLPNELPLDLLLSMLEEGCGEGGAYKLIDIASLNHFAMEKSNRLTAPIIDAFRKGAIPLNEIVPSFEETFAKEIIRLYFASNRTINDFNSSIFDQELAQYRELIQQYSSLIIEEVTANATKNLVMGRYEYKGSSPVGRLKTIVSNGGRGTTIRNILERYNDIVRGYFPCFLMSPLSAAQYLSVDDNSTKPFDIVIFDEASQIPVHEAIGPIARGTSLIVAGDPKQMPPTTYFTTDINLTGEELDYQDASSLLDECIAIDFPRIRLSYHYRSRYESLINFSNRNFYDGELHTFPAPMRGKRAIRFEKVELAEAKTDSTMSIEETKAILSRLNRIYSKEHNKNKSVGIIVFNVKQKESLEKTIEAYLEEDRALAKKIKDAETASGEPLFVKSLENVQGDERDIIILCIGFRKTIAGRAFVVGPLTRVGGERRLNVAISRSKERMYVISTITDDDFDSDPFITTKGALLLKHFIAYARGEEEYRNLEEEVNLTSSRMSVADFIRKDLEQMGYLCDSDVGESKNKVDIAIRGETLNTYALGILLDDDLEVNSATLRDKEYVEPTVFNHLNWKIVKVYAVSYFKNKEAVIRRIVEAMDKPFIKMEMRIEPTLSPKEIDVSYDCKPYEKVDMDTLDPITYRSDIGYSRTILSDISRIIYVEGPICLSQIKDRIKEKAGLTMLSRLGQILLEREMANFEYLKDADGFYWPLDGNKQMQSFRLAGDRELYEIPLEEYECAFFQILKRQGKLEQNDLFKATLEAFQYKGGVLTKKNKEYLTKIYEVFHRKYPNI